MKKWIIIISIILLSILSACGLRERILSPPDEFTIPEGSKVAICTKDDNEYKFIYKEDGVYLYYINDEEQDQDALDYLLEEAYSHGSSVDSYLNDEFKDACIITNYVEEEVD